MPQNELLSKLSSTFKKMTFSKSEFPIGTSILNTSYVYPRSQNNNLFSSFNDQLDYIFTYLFAKLETTKHKVNKFLLNSLMKHITKKLLYCKIDE